MSQVELRTAYVVGRLDRTLRRTIEGGLTPLGVTLTQFTTLTVIARRAGLSNAQLARRALVTPQAMQQVLAALTEKGFVRRTADPTHQGILLTSLTSAGEALVTAGEAVIEGVEARMLAGIPRNRQQEFLDDLRGCVSHLDGGLDP